MERDQFVFGCFSFRDPRLRIEEHAVRRIRLSNLSYAVSCLTRCFRIFRTSQQKMHAVLREDDLTDILLEMPDLNITLNLADNKLCHIN